MLNRARMAMTRMEMGSINRVRRLLVLKTITDLLCSIANDVQRGGYICVIIGD
jgi:hypothetical protein